MPSLIQSLTFVHTDDRGVESRVDFPAGTPVTPARDGDLQFGEQISLCRRSIDLYSRKGDRDYECMMVGGRPRTLHRRYFDTTFKEKSDKNTQKTSFEAQKRDLRHIGKGGTDLEKKGEGTVAGPFFEPQMSSGAGEQESRRQENARNASISSSPLPSSPPPLAPYARYEIVVIVDITGTSYHHVWQLGYEGKPFEMPGLVQQSSEPISPPGQTQATKRPANSLF